MRGNVWLDGLESATLKAPTDFGDRGSSMALTEERNILTVEGLSLKREKKLILIRLSLECVCLSHTFDHSVTKKRRY